MEMWRQCARWLIECRVLPPNHRVMWDTAQVCDLAQALRDGVLLCQLLNNLLPHAVNLREINLRPQMSQFLCLKNIRTFLLTCCEKFGLKKNELFEAFDLFDVRDFGKVIDTLSFLSWSSVAQDKGYIPFPSEDSLADEDIYNGLNDQIDETVEDDDELYDCVDMEEDEGDEIYEDLMKSEIPPCQLKSEVDKRGCCLQEIQQTEEKYTDTLESIYQYFMKPLQRFLRKQDMEDIFINVEDLLKLHRSFCEEVKQSVTSNGAQNLHQVFLKYKERFLLYGRYCSQVEFATKHLDKTANAREDVQMKLEECSKRANNGRFSLRDLLMVPMQRVLKYHLLLHELVKHTTDATEKENLKLALDAMRDLAQCVNEVKRDNETLRQITNFQLSIENLNESLAQYGRPKIDGELKITSVEKRSKMDRYAFLLDKALLLCKRKGETFEMKDFINLHNYQIRDDSAGERDNKKWCHLFLLIESHGVQGYELFFKTRDLKKKWMEQFEMALSNIYPESATANGHEFQMHSFEETASCKSCQMLLRGVFFQGYRCSRCKSPAHKECLGRVPPCGKKDCLTKRKNPPSSSPSLTKMEVCEDYLGFPPPPLGFGSPLKLRLGEIVELTKADAEQNWWERCLETRLQDPYSSAGRNTLSSEVGWFPCNKVKPYVSVPLPDFSGYTWYAGPMERKEAEVALNNRSDGTYLVRQRVNNAGEFAISIKFNVEVKHIKVTTLDGLYRITEKKVFRSLIELVEYYKHNSLKDCFKSLDTMLLCTFREPERRSMPTSAEASLRNLGSAMARYDFCARDRTELTIKQGDIVKILHKKGHQGWWKGEIYGKIGWFPANYVEEDYSEYC